MKHLLQLAIATVFYLQAAAQTPISVQEKNDLLFMWQEEKLARDAYDFMYSRYQTNPFGNIRHSERRHMHEMENLLEKFGVKDASQADTAAGKFSDTSLAMLYKTCISKSSLSMKEALSGGALIEETDIKDLQLRISHTSNKEIIASFQYLLMGSENHLRAFNRRLGNMGVNYKPVVLSAENFNKIINN
ncbi:MAG: DUF2202 domain-containing protein [Ferruginibacter sp.]